MDTTKIIKIKFSMDIMGNWWLIWENLEERISKSIFIGKEIGKIPTEYDKAFFESLN